jgi:hypothetical protein
MRTKVKLASPEATLARILEALEQELIDAPEEEVLEAAQALGMNPRMKGSAAFAGLKYSAKPQLLDFFEFELCRNAQSRIDGSVSATQSRGEIAAPQAESAENPRDVKTSGDEESS